LRLQRRTGRRDAQSLIPTHGRDNQREIPITRERISRMSAQPKRCTRLARGRADAQSTPSWIHASTPQSRRLWYRARNAPRRGLQGE